MSTCNKCKHWGDGDGGGQPYDAGHVNRCNHPSISGPHHHPASTLTKLYVDPASGADQVIMTRRDFGCNLFEAFAVKK